MDFNPPDKLEEARNSENKWQLPEIYGINGIERTSRAMGLFMSDLITEALIERRNPLVNKKVKQGILKEFQKVTGSSQSSSYNYFNSAANEVSHFVKAAFVLADVIQDNYDLREQFQDNANAAELGSQDRTNALRGKREANKDIADIAVKIVQDQTNREKVQVLKEKVHSDSALGSAQLALNFAGSLDKKKENIKKLIKNKKAFREILNEVKLKESDEGDSEVFEATVVDDESK